MTTITIARTQLLLLAFFVFLAGLNLGNALAAFDAGRSPLWSALSAVASLLAAWSVLRQGIARAATPPHARAT